MRKDILFIKFNRHKKVKQLIYILSLLSICVFLFSYINTNLIANNDLNVKKNNNIIIDIYPKTSAPSITINSPSDNDLFNATAPVFDVSITDGNLDAMWYNIGSTSENRTFLVNETFNQADWDTIANGTLTTITF
ncbi:hypothetical protein LCGC14_2764500, partial [marine sediment metagenome]